MSAEASASRLTYAGLFSITLATLLYEILLTRIFSVTLFYHFAFVAVSIVLFGLTVGALLVYFFPAPQKQVKRYLAISALLFGTTSVVSLAAYLSTPVRLDELEYFALTYILISIPFTFSGVCVSLVLTRFQQIGKLYAADLAGAACGCILLIYVLRIIDGPGAVIVVGILGCVGGGLFALDAGLPKLFRGAVVCCVFLALFLGAHSTLTRQQLPVLHVKWMGGIPQHTPFLYEKWNSLSRILISGDPNRSTEPFGWGLSPIYPHRPEPYQLALYIDSGALTVLTGFHGQLQPFDYLKYDVTNMAHYIRHDAKVLVIGAGGGRDILSALVFGQNAVTAVEINQNIIDAVNRVFGNFTGHLDRNPRVAFVNDEARSFIARQREHYDIIEASLIDTGAATAAGALSLSENSIYTVEAWKLFLERLSPHGVLSFSRSYLRGAPVEMYRLAALASASLKLSGVADPRPHIIMVRYLPDSVGIGTGTILIGKSPFSDQDVATIKHVSQRLRFDVVLGPGDSMDPVIASLASGNGPGTLGGAFPLNTSAPTDDTPFFFQELRFSSAIVTPALWRAFWKVGLGVNSVFIIGVLLMVVIGLTFLCILVPLILTTRKNTMRGALPLLLFFASIGFGFILIEVSQMQRLMIFLGHPTYSLSVVLFSLLLASGVGSYLTQRIDRSGRRSTPILIMSILLLALALFGTLTPHIIHTLQSATTMIRVSATAAMLFPMGLFMGMPFPLGMQLASPRFSILTPWLWGINGATSVCGSVLAVVIALNTGISAAFWTGVAFYAVALIVLPMACKRREAPGQTSGS